MLPQTSLATRALVDGANNEDEDAVVPGQEELSSEELEEIEKQAKKEAEDVEEKDQEATKEAKSP